MDTQITNIVEQTVLERMRAKTSFTALDISNALKADRYAVRHGQVAANVRDIYQSGAMGYYDYDRKLIDVVTGGAKKTQAFLYLHTGTRERDYTARTQGSLPLVAPDQARDLSDCAAASLLPLFTHPAGRRLRTKTPHTGQGRRDGALAVPRALVEMLGWTKGMSLTLQCESGRLVIAPRTSTSGEPEVRVWGGHRVRVCKTKLKLGLLTAEQVTVEVVGEGLNVTARG